MLGRCRAFRSTAAAAIALTAAMALTPARPAAGQSSFIGSEILTRLISQHPGKTTWNFSNTNALPTGWLIQNPPDTHWGQLSTVPPQIRGRGRDRGHRRR